jgi:hypothetical protein
MSLALMEMEDDDGRDWKMKKKLQRNGLIEWYVFMQTVKSFFK